LEKRGKFKSWEAVTRIPSKLDDRIRVQAVLTLESDPDAAKKLDHVATPIRTPTTSSKEGAAIFNGTFLQTPEQQQKDVMMR